MILLSIIVVVVSIFEIMILLKKKLKKELILYLCMAAITLAFGYFYLSNPYRSSFTNVILNLLGVKH